ncbi:hypothetical protein BN2537_11291 [Streptomyces venezuelae]|nr:hypothetical protein BN2537_11291 [Streptomyces venezuelae]
MPLRRPPGRLRRSSGCARPPITWGTDGTIPIDSEIEPGVPAGHTYRLRPGRDRRHRRLAVDRLPGPT